MKYVVFIIVCLLAVGAGAADQEYPMGILEGAGGPDSSATEGYDVRGTTNKYGYEFTPTADVTLDSVLWYGSGHGATADMVFYVYPDTLTASALVDSTDRVSATTAIQTRKFTFQGGETLTQGETYWLAIRSHDQAYRDYYDDNDSVQYCAGDATITQWDTPNFGRGKEPSRSIWLWGHTADGPVEVTGKTVGAIAGGGAKW